MICLFAIQMKKKILFDGKCELRLFKFESNVPIRKEKYASLTAQIFAAINAYSSAVERKQQLVFIMTSGGA